MGYLVGKFGAAEAVSVKSFSTPKYCVEIAVCGHEQGVF